MSKPKTKAVYGVPCPANGYAVSCGVSVFFRASSAQGLSTVARMSEVQGTSWGESLHNLPQLRVDLFGEWVVEKTPTLAGGVATTRRWKGLARASQPLVALAVLVDRDFMYWGKSEAKTEPDGCPITLALFHYDNLGLDVEVNLTAGGGGTRTRTTVNSVDYLPPIHSFQLVCGELVKLASIDGRPEIEIGLLFLPRGAVHKGRTGNWRLKGREPSAGLLSAVIAGPRSGSRKAFGNR